MERWSVDQDEMDKRSNRDLIAKLNMIGEGSPIHPNYPYDEGDVFEKGAHTWPDDKELPETYQ